MISVIGRLDKSFENISETPNEQGKQLFLAYVVKFEEENEVLLLAWYQEFSLEE
ncbi:hypothetical protein [Bacillus velezensis]|uniref:hypothetical protein n=1 Tax=Bacillus velezensis TaxID=492670 RepID=UPI0018E86D9C|nr:hypothetical protein [Bacillus velezensis]